MIDVGAGDGGYAVHRARGEPNTFAIAIDASPDALSDGAWRAHRLRLSNVAFLVTAVEQLPGALDETADEITVHFPWGSLLRGMLAADSSIVGRLAGSLRTEGELRLLVSAVERDGYSKVTPARLLELAPRYEALGLDLVESGWATPADIARSRSSWAKRLGPRPAVLAIFRRHPRIHSQSRSTQVGPGMAGNLDSEGRHSVSAGGQIRMCHPEVPPGTPVPDVRSEETSIPLGSESMPALVVFPEHTPAPAILVINDISGRSPFYDHLARRIAQAGFVATTPEYFFRQGPLAEPTREAAGARAKKLDFVRWGDDMSAALEWLRARPEVNGTIGTIGFCMGGTQALLLAARRDDIAATVSYYGFPADARTSASPIDTAGRMHGPILGHWGDQDAGVGMENVAKLDAGLRSAGVEHEFHIYPGLGHGFLKASLEGEGTPGYDQACTSWRRTLEFYRRCFARETVLR